MISGLIAAFAVLVAWPSGARRRRRDVLHPGVRRRLNLVLVATILTPLAGYLIFGALGLIVGLAATGVVRKQVNALGTLAAKRRNEAITRQAPAALDLITAALRAGRPPEGALAVVAEHTPAPLGELLQDVSRRIRISADPAAAWRVLDGTPLEVVGRAFARSDSSGAAVVPLALDAAEDLRRRARAVRRESVGRVAVQTTVPLGLCLLPAFVLVAVAPIVLAVVTNIGP